MMFIFFTKTGLLLGLGWAAGAFEYFMMVSKRHGLS
jgi:hypothetical protein